MPEGVGLRQLRTSQIVVSGLILTGWALLALCMGRGLGREGSDAGAYIGLLTLLSLSGPLLLLWAAQAPIRGFSPVWPCLILTLVGSLVAALLTADFGSTAAFGGQLLAFLAVIGAGLSFETKVFFGRSGGLLTLFCTLLVLVLPFGLDAVLVQSHDPAVANRLLEVVCVTSPTLTLTTCTPTRFRLLKQRRIYERFRVAEQILPVIAVTRTMIAYLVAATVLVALTAVIPSRSA